MVAVRYFLALAEALLFFSLGAFSASVSQARHHERSIFEKRSASEKRWSRRERLDGGLVIPLKVGLKQNNLDRIEEELLAVSDPTSPRYGKHWTPQEVADFFVPSDETIMLVADWLHAAGLDKQRHRFTNGGTWINVNATVNEIESLLDTEYYWHEHDSGARHLACDSYSVPNHLHDHIELISPTVQFDANLRPSAGFIKRDVNNVGAANTGNGPKTAGTVSKVQQELEYCDEQILPICLQALYNIPPFKPEAADRNSYGIVEYTPQAYLPEDLDLFFGNFSPSMKGQRPTLVSVDGGYAQSTYQSFDYNGESDLDLQYAMALVAPQRVTLYQTGDMVQGASFNNFLDAIDASYCTFEGGDDPENDAIYADPFGGYQKQDCGIVKPANVISTSYSLDEAEVPASYAIRQCNEYAKLGLQGSTILYASGDYGVAGSSGDCLGSDGTMFNPNFPASCPYVTAVGATQMLPNATVYDKEVACEDVIYSGGGFSNYFALPSYQASAVEHYLTTYPPAYTSQQYNTSSVRGFPDVSANGANYIVVIDEELALVYGTSASSPVIGSIIVMINDARLSEGKPPLGFLNPLIYSQAVATLFNDITEGSNPGCNTNGFNATLGWDPVTGLGTPNFEKLVEALRFL